MKEEEVFKHQRKTVGHFLWTATWNKRDLMTVLHHGSDEGPIPDNQWLCDGWKKRLVLEDR